MTKFYSKEDEYKDVLKSGKTPDKAIYKEFVESETRKINEELLQIDFTISTNSVDRMHDTINQDGWDLRSFKKNPIVLWAHDQSQPPVAKAIPRSVKTDGNKLIATAQFMPADISEFSYMIFQMYKMGFMNATSVGFRPKEWSFAEDNDRPYGINFEKQELLEFSCVPVPANADALISAKSMGLNTRPLKAWVENTLDNWKEDNGLMVPRDNIENLFKSLTARTKLLKPIEEVFEKEVTEEEKELDLYTKANSLNGAGVAYANGLVHAGSVDKSSGWSFSGEDGNALLGPDDHDWTNYGKHFLGVNSDVPKETKAHYKYPVAKGGKVYRSGVIAAKQRAAQQNDSGIEAAASALLDKIDNGKDFQVEETKMTEVTETVEKKPKATELGASETANPPILGKIKAAHDMHQTAELLSKEASGIHKKAFSLTKKLFDPDNPGDGSGDNYETAGKEVGTEVIKSNNESDNDSDVGSSLEHNPPILEQARAIHAMHTCAMNLSKQAFGVHKAAACQMKSIVDPDGDGDDDTLDPNDQNDSKKSFEGLDLQAKMALLDELIKSIKEEDKTVDIVISKASIEVVAKAEVEEDEDSFILFDDSVDKAEDSVNLEDVKELLKDVLPELDILISNSIKAKLNS